ncbi:MAG: alpha/beta hydrolase [Armatimonadota bacterium]|nr:alpha/beta hydrolase [Armatimonadota bacterium]MDR5696353.1 alpha/beta hydrolase [Armatimonadota bacterium]
MTHPQPGKRLAIVFLHGAGGRGQIWQNQLLDFPIAIAPDLPGHPEGRPFDRVEDYAAWLRAFLDRGGMHGVVLVGHSMGGAVALRAALDAPDSLRGLVLVSTGAHLPVDPDVLDGLHRAPLRTIDRVVETWFVPGADARQRERVRTAIRELGPDTLLRDLSACARFDVRDRVHEIRLPTLILCGDADIVTPPALSSFLHERMTRSDLIVVPGAGHMLPLQRRVAFRDALRRFLAALAAEGAG